MASINPKIGNRVMPMTISANAAISSSATIMSFESLWGIHSDAVFMMSSLYDVELMIPNFICLGI